jgi:hypothetical protein
LTVERLIDGRGGDDQSPWDIFYRHNPSDTFVTLAAQAFDDLYGSTELAAIEEAAAGTA